MRIAVVNAGSTSVKFAVSDNNRLVRQRETSPAVSEPQRMLHDVFGNDPVAIVHRVVQGGTRFSRSALVDDAVLDAIERLGEIAPLHNPMAVRWIKATRNAFPNAAQVAVFDTGFFTAMPEHAYRYAIPRGIADHFGIRRYGYHGLAHHSMHDQWCVLRPDLDRGGRLITLQLGGGSSMTASKSGRVMDTSMGFSPLEGLVMATRSGDIDFAAAAYLGRKTRRDLDAVERVLNEESGLLGLSEISGDMATLLASDDPSARGAIDVYCHRARKYVGAYLAVLGGTDGILFGGGVGENASAIRARILQDMDWAGIRLDPAVNAALRAPGRISPRDSPVEVRVVAVDEARLMVQEASRLLVRRGAAGAE